MRRVSGLLVRSTRNSLHRSFLLPDIFQLDVVYFGSDFDGRCSSSVVLISVTANFVLVVKFEVAVKFVLAIDFIFAASQSPDSTLIFSKAVKFNKQNIPSFFSRNFTDIYIHTTTSYNETQTRSYILCIVIFLLYCAQSLKQEAFIPPSRSYYLAFHYITERSLQTTNFASPSLSSEFGALNLNGYKSIFLT